MSFSSHSPQYPPKDDDLGVVLKELERIDLNARKRHFFLVFILLVYLVVFLLILHCIPSFH
jgi:hypothetical protein